MVCQISFNTSSKFKSGDTSLEDVPRSGRPTEVDSSNIKALIEQDRKCGSSCYGRSGKQKPWPVYCLMAYTSARSLSECEALIPATGENAVIGVVQRWPMTVFEWLPISCSQPF
ncbi:unnamed protein product [Nezara viridula]|uniref:Uncharacterized protein n=1 Tax=Nezara viridula TaxID=85310 RepID=A0A9P0E950_NEZVI|nr:unnamed protein product [Nezara viridula]